jgi:chromosome segregation ATPase
MEFNNARDVSDTPDMIDANVTSKAKANISSDVDVASDTVNSSDVDVESNVDTTCEASVTSTIEIRYLKNEIETLKTALKNAKEVENVHKECIQIAVDQIKDLKNKIQVVNMTMVNLTNSFRNLEKRFGVLPKEKETAEQGKEAYTFSAVSNAPSSYSEHMTHSLYLENISMKKIIETLEKGEATTEKTINFMNLTIETLKETIKTLEEENQKLRKKLGKE